MSKNLSTVNRVTEPLIPGDGVVVTPSVPGEAGYEGYVSREIPTNGDSLYVNITKANHPLTKPLRLSYKRENLILVRRNGK